MKTRATWGGSLLVNAHHLIPYTIQNAVRDSTTHQLKTWIQEYGTVVAFQQLRVLGSKASVGFLVDLHAPGIISAQGYTRLAFALKMLSLIHI